MDKETIMKALECCSNESLLKCSKCPRRNKDAKCMYRLSREALYLIKELNSEIERLQDRIDDLEMEIEYHNDW